VKARAKARALADFPASAASGSMGPEGTMRRRVLPRVGVAAGLLLVVVLAVPGVRWEAWARLPGNALSRCGPFTNAA
jgi:hypothetical protein